MRHKCVALIAAACVFISAALRADEVIDKGRDIFKDHQRAVVTVQVVQKYPAMQGRNSQEVKQDFSGTVIAPDGLIVAALSSCDPGELYRKLSESTKFEIEITDIKILLEDGTEMPAEIVLRDKDLDLAFIRTKTKPAAPLAFVDLTQSSTVDVLDNVIVLNRLNQAAGRAFAAYTERICAVLHKPRTIYIPETGMTEYWLGSPAYALDGKLVGLFVMRAVNASGAGSSRDCITSIILPAGDVAKAAAQAPTEVKADEPKPEAPKDQDKEGKDSAPKSDAPKAGEK
jgi:hypothetical protein